jgi:hypothetical protein
MAKELKEWIKFVDITPSDGKRKTKIYAVVSTYTDCTLGHVTWFSRWRRYAFAPSPDTVYEQECLKRIIVFMDNLMYLRRSKHNKG